MRRRSHVECCSALRKCNARVEERRLIARNDRALYLELVVAVVILLSPLVVIQYNKQKSFFWWCYMQGTPAVLYAGHVQISVRTVVHSMVLSKLLFWSKSFSLFTFFTGPLVLRTGTVPARPPGFLTVS